MVACSFAVVALRAPAALWVRSDAAEATQLLTGRKRVRRFAGSATFRGYATPQHLEALWLRDSKRFRDFVGSQFPRRSMVMLLEGYKSNISWVREYKVFLQFRKISQNCFSTITILPASLLGQLSL